MSEPDYDFLNNEEATDDAAPEVSEQPAPAETVATPEPPAPEVPTTSEPREERVPVAAVIAERRKRQELEERLRHYEQQLQRQQAPAFHEAPEQFIEQRLATRVFAMSEAQARELYPDYDDVVAEFVETAQGNPYLIHELNASAHPAAFAYKQGKQMRERKEMEDLPAYKAKLEAEIRAKLQAEFKAQEDAKARAVAAVPPDLSAARSPRDGDVVVDDSLDSILSSRKR